jgi:hypothetical protein
MASKASWENDMSIALVATMDSTNLNNEIVSLIWQPLCLRDQGHKFDYLEFDS